MADDDDALRLIFEDDDKPTAPAPEPPGNVDMTVRLTSGETWRVATVGEVASLTIAGADGMATLRLSPSDAEILADALNAGTRDVRARRRGAAW